LKDIFNFKKGGIMESNQNTVIHFVHRVIKYVPSLIDGIVRWVDDFLGRKRDFLKRRSLLAFFFPVPVFLFIVLGPSLAGDTIWRGGTIAFALIAGVLILQLIYFQQDKFRGMAWVQLGLVIGLVISTLCIAKTEAVQASTDLYYHYYSFLTVIAMLVAVPLASFLKRFRFFTPPETDLAKLHKVYDAEQVSAQGEPRELNLWDVIGAYGLAVLRKPLHVIGIVSVVVLALPPDNLKFWAVITFFISLMLMATSIYDPKRDAFVRLFQRVFFSGGALLVTLAVILLAILRLAEVDYVTTVLDAGSKRTLFSYIISTYALFWFYDFWINQAIVDLVIKNNYFSDDSETIRRHGGGRIAIINTQAEGKNRRRMFEPAAFLMRIAQIAPDTTREQLQEAAKRAEQQFRSFAAVCLLLFAGVVSIIGYYIHNLEQKPGLVAQTSEQGAFNLSEHLVSSNGDPVIMLAASGGGTRAALYTAAVLRGLSIRGQLDRMVLASGVSGGSAALAYYAVHRPNLDDQAAWKDMIDTLASPFIDDVLAGAAEGRIVSKYRLGQLLTESFERRFLATALSEEVKQRTTFSAVNDIGLIFNTALCGSPAANGAAHDKASKLSAGGRLVITNLTSDFDKKTFTKDTHWHPEMDYEIVRPSRASLFEAASLSANFPPVFSNAAVKVDNAPPFWVTDGGAVENRGVLSILLALADTLGSDLSEKQKANLADIRIIVADASAFNPEYKSDRGMGAKFGASEQLANRLIAELITRVSKLHNSITRRDNGIQVFYLPMPDAMRAKGTFGTHWMMPDYVTLKNPWDTKEGIEIKKEDLKELMVAMFSKEYSKEYLSSKWPEDSAKQIWEETKDVKDQLEVCMN
jgi:hypothetical protein